MSNQVRLDLKALAKIKAKLNALPKGVEKALKAQLDTDAAGLVTAMKANAPFDEGNAEHQHLRDSVHFYDNPKRAIGVIILADAKDADGKFIGSNVEAGHRAVNGEHVAARPFFFPTYRAQKKGIKRRLSAAGRAAIKKGLGVE